MGAWDELLEMARTGKRPTAAQTAANDLPPTQTLPPTRFWHVTRDGQRFLGF